MGNYIVIYYLYILYHEREFLTRHVKQTADEEAPARILAIEFVCFLSSFLSFFLSFSLALFLFFSSFPPTFSIFSRSNAHTHTNKGVDFQKGLFVRFNMARDEEFAKDLVRSTCSKSNKGGGKRRGKAGSRQIYGSLLHSICGLQINVWLGAFI